MKLGKTSWLILGIGIFIIAAASLYTVYLRQGREQAQLNDSLAEAQAKLPEVVAEKEAAASQLVQLEAQLAQLEDELAQATSRLDRADRNFPRSVESIEVDVRLFKIADEWDLDIIKLTASEPADRTTRPTTELGDQNIEDVTFAVTSFTADVAGEVADILNFINTVIIDDAFTTITVESVNITLPVPLTEEEKEELTEAEIAEAEKPSATIRLVIYSYRGE